MRISDYTLDSFTHEFYEYDRDNYSSDGYAYLFELLNETSPNEELDVIGICCDWTEYDEDDLVFDYSYLGDNAEEIMMSLEYRTTCAQLPNGDYMVCAFAG